ncbi:MAG TPA: hypothetical protein VIJ82_20615 [Streptosporangiaceae bacterium]|jgi:hypothetical protein
MSGRAGAVGTAGEQTRINGPVDIASRGGPGPVGPPGYAVAADGGVEPRPDGAVGAGLIGACSIGLAVPALLGARSCLAGMSRSSGQGGLDDIGGSSLVA